MSTKTGWGSDVRMRDATLLTPQLVARKTTFLEWRTQPSVFKRYPDFCYRIAIDRTSPLFWLGQVRCITDQNTVSGKPYYRLNVPSAGNLHPLEMYLQIRNVSGILDGMYHWDTASASIVLISEIERDGIERYIGIDRRFNGCVVMFSVVPFRSAWKYALRAWRYVYLDLGHQIAALQYVVNFFGLPTTKLSDIDILDLNRIMGMGEDELIVSVFAVGEPSSKPAVPLESPLMIVPPCDYLYRDPKLTEAVAREGAYTDYPPVFQPIWDENVNLTRRSARDFSPQTMKAEAIREILQLPHNESLDVLHIIAHPMHTGVYRSGKKIQNGNFSADAVHLLLEQRFISNASVVSLIFSVRFDSHSHIEAGIYAHGLYLLAERNGIGCSGIGAFYDEEALRWSNMPLLYAVAIGGKI